MSHPGSHAELNRREAEYFERTDTRVDEILASMRAGATWRLPQIYRSLAGYEASCFKGRPRYYLPGEGGGRVAATVEREEPATLNRARARGLVNIRILPRIGSVVLWESYGTVIAAQVGADCRLHGLPEIPAWMAGAEVFKGGNMPSGLEVAA